MSNTPTTPLEPLVTEAQITWRSLCAENGVILEEQSFLVGVHWVRDIYEADRVKREEVMREAAEAIGKLTRILGQLHLEIMHLPQASIEKMTPQQFNFLYTKDSGPLHDAKELVPAVRALLSKMNERTNTP